MSFLDRIGREILDGVISLNPYELGSEEACTWCPYKKVCGFESSMPGCNKRKLGEMDALDALENMREDLGVSADRQEKP